MRTPPCVVCGGDAWRALPDAAADRSVTTAGRIVPEPLGKSQCRRCALVQRARYRPLARTDFYETDYSSYFERPGAKRFDRERYDVMAQWIRAAIDGSPAAAFDAGCGRGWMIDAMRQVFPATRFTGIEPSEADSAWAREAGHDVRTGRVTAALSTGQVYDLVYSTNVLEHTESPVDFLIGLRNLLAPSGRVVITCPDGSRPNQEIMFSDQSFSFLPAHLDALGGRAGLAITGVHQAPPYVGVRDKQLVVYRRSMPAEMDAGVRVTTAEEERLYRERRAYLHAWEACREWLREASAGARTVYNFGTSTWSFLLAAYCPEYWDRVTACIIDGGAGEFFGKPVLDAGQAAMTRGDVLVLGVDPASQPRFRARFDGQAAQIITWNHIIDR